MLHGKVVWVAVGGTGQNAHQRLFWGNIVRLFWENIVPLESHHPSVCFFQQRAERYKCGSVFRSKATIQSVCHNRSAGADASRKDGIKWHVAGECRLFPLHLGPSNDILEVGPYDSGGSRVLHKSARRSADDLPPTEKLASILHPPIFVSNTLHRAPNTNGVLREEPTAGQTREFHVTRKIAIPNKKSRSRNSMALERAINCCETPSDAFDFWKISFLSQYVPCRPPIVENNHPSHRTLDHAKVKKHTSTNSRQNKGDISLHFIRPTHL